MLITKYNFTIELFLRAFYWESKQHKWYLPDGKLRTLDDYCPLTCFDKFPAASVIDISPLIWEPASRIVNASDNHGEFELRTVLLRICLL